MLQKEFSSRIHTKSTENTSFNSSILIVFIFSFFSNYRSYDSNVTLLKWFLVRLRVPIPRALSYDCEY